MSALLYAGMVKSCTFRFRKGGIRYRISLIEIVKNFEKKRNGKEGQKDELLEFALHIRMDVLSLQKRTDSARILHLKERAADEALAKYFLPEGGITEHVPGLESFLWKQEYNWLDGVVDKEIFKPRSIRVSMPVAIHRFRGGKKGNFSPRRISRNIQQLLQIAL